MTEPTFEQLIERYEMGLAYQRITEQMGPSPQLIAFINYDQVTSDSVGLESFNIQSQHEQILADIEADRSYEMACESFVGKVKSALGRIKIALTLNSHAKDLDKFLSGKLEPRSSSVNTVSHADFEKLRSIISTALPTISVAQNLPVSSTDLEGWSKLNLDHLNEQYDLFFKKSREVLAIKTGDFEKSGWTADNFKTGIKEYKALSDKAMVIYHRAETQVEDLLKLADKNSKKEHAASVKAVIAQFNLMYEAATLLEEGEAKLWKTLNDTAQHFSVVE